MRRRRDHPRRYVAYGAMTAASVACLSLLVVTNAGFPGRVPEEVQALSDRKDMMAFRCTEEIVLVATSDKLRCIVGAPWNSASKRAILWGDSHAKHLLPLLDLPARELGLSVAYWPGCPPFIDREALQREKLNKPTYSEKCARSRRAVLDWIAKTPGIDLVIVSNEWAVFPEKLYRHRGGILDEADPGKALELIKQGLVTTIAEIRRQRHPILFIGDVPRPVFSVPDCALRKVTGLWRQPCRKFRDFFAESERPAETILKGIAAKANDIYFLDAQKAMCAGPEACSIRVGKEIIYRDGDHLRHDLNLAIRRELVSKLRLGVVLSLALGRYVAERDAGSTPQVLAPQ